LAFRETFGRNGEGAVEAGAGQQTSFVVLNTLGADHGDLLLAHFLRLSPGAGINASATGKTSFVMTGEAKCYSKP
jgi:hypothetical protein